MQALTNREGWSRSAILILGKFSTGLHIILKNTLKNSETFKIFEAFPFDSKNYEIKISLSLCISYLISVCISVCRWSLGWVSGAGHSAYKHMCTPSYARGYSLVSHQTVATSNSRRTYSLGNTTKWALFWLAQLFLKSLTPTLLRLFPSHKHLSGGNERNKVSVRDYKTQGENKNFCQHPRWCTEIYPKML